MAPPNKFKGTKYGGTDPTGYKRRRDQFTDAVGQGIVNIIKAIGGAIEGAVFGANGEPNDWDTIGENLDRLKDQGKLPISAEGVNFSDPQQAKKYLEQFSEYRARGNKPPDKTGPKVGVDTGRYINNNERVPVKAESGGWGDRNDEKMGAGRSRRRTPQDGFDPRDGMIPPQDKKGLADYANEEEKSPMIQAADKQREGDEVFTAFQPEETRQVQDNTKIAQGLLLEAGYDLGPDGADGLHGPKTAEAIKAFQTKIGEPTTGDLTRKQLDTLQGLLKARENQQRTLDFSATMP